VIEQWLMFACILSAAIALSMLFDYRNLYAGWLFSIPFFRNLLNIRTPVSDFKLPYLLFIPVLLGALFSWSEDRAPDEGKIEFSRLRVALAILLGVTVVTVLVSPAPSAGLRVIARICYVAAVVLVSIRALIREDTSKVLKIWTVSLIAAVTLGFVFYATGTLPPGYTINLGNGPITVEAVSDNLLAEYDIGESLAVKRYALGFGNLYDTSADFAILGVFLSAGWAICAGRRAGFLRWFWCAIGTVALLLTYTRGAWLCCVLGILVLAYALKLERRFVLAFGGIVVVVALFNPASISDRVISVDPSEWSRLARLTTAINIIGQHPIAGAGPGVFTQELTNATANWQLFDPDSDVSAHSAMIEYLGEQGILGLAALTVLLACYFRLGWKLLKRFRREPRPTDVMACTVVAVFTALTLHAFALPAFEDSFWVTYAIGYVLAVKSLSSPLALGSIPPFRTGLRGGPVSSYGE
jgi:hypothetical protein